MWKVLWARFILWKEGYCFKHNEFYDYCGSLHQCLTCMNIRRDINEHERLTKMKTHEKLLNEAIELIKKA
jgi:hypothetical protein